MMQRAALILCVALFALPAHRAWSETDEISSEDIQGPAMLAQSGAAHDQNLLMSQAVARCAPSDRSPEPADPATTSAIPRSERFVARDHFKEAVSSPAAVKITWLGAMFRQRFLSKIEDDGSGAILRRFMLRRSSQNAEIIVELNIHHETKLADLWCLLSRQPNGEPGTLLVNSIPNVFYIRDADGDLRAVDALWGGAGWEIGASAMDGATRWPTGSQMISR